jgi:hypothetical protein
MAIVARLLLLLSVLLMPLGMGPAAASAPSGHQAMMAGTSMDHCPEQSNKHERSEGMAFCSMACASALPAQDLARNEMCRRRHQLVAPAIGHMLTGIHPEIATPPPRIA